ncbi:MAG: hypothetical protein FJ363_05510 [Gemmatimonadetes bacterium]|nr:hypothetical protein [Gemmatimonadota bacterium]
MSTTDRDTVETVEKLLAERQKVAGWLSALSARRDATPPAVFEKVHDDYSAKLAKVQAKLTAAADGVQAAAADLAARLTDREEALAKKQDERSEAELRYAVGEYSEREWEKRRGRLDEELVAATGERNSLLDDLHRLRDVLNDVAGRAAAPDADAPAAYDVIAAIAPSGAESAPSFPYEGEVASMMEAEPTPIEAEPIAAEPAVSADETAPVVSVKPVIPIHEQSVIAPVEPAQSLAPSFDELEFLKSVVGRSTPAGARHPAEPALVPKRGDSKRATPAAKRASEPTPPPMASVPPAPPAAPPVEENPYAVPEPPMPFPDPVPEPRVSQEMTPPRESFFGRPTPRTSEAVKSLRCQECGTLNFPTEWYCERCGGELAAL